MYEKCLNEAELILRREGEHLLPVRTVWEEVVKRSKITGFEVAALADFSAMMEGDRRFQIIPARKEGEEPGEEPTAGDGLDDAELEQLGFFPEDRVKLTAISAVQENRRDEEEEIGSIRRRAFTNQAENKTKVVNKKNAAASLAHKTRTVSKKKKSAKRSLKAPKRRKRAPVRRTGKSKARARKKK